MGTGLEKKEEQTWLTLWLAADVKLLAQPVCYLVCVAGSGNCN